MNALPTPTRPTPEIKFGATTRRDNWWLEPLLNFVGFTAFVIYSMWVTFTPILEVSADKIKVLSYKWPLIPVPEGTMPGAVEGHGVYLSPFYSPEFDVAGWFFPAILVLWMPLGFRATCYYYRKMYYRTYFMDPPGCAVGDHKGHKYGGEKVFPWVLQNAHRWFLYLAIFVVAVLWYDAFISMWITPEAATAVNAAYPDAKVVSGFHFGLGTAVLLINAFLLSGYTFGCHAARHLAGGNVDCWSATPLGQTRFKIWSFITKLNEHHMGWAWISMIMVGLADLYVRLLVMFNVPYSPWL